MKKIVVIGAGRTDFSLAYFLAQCNNIVVVDLFPGKIDLINYDLMHMADGEAERVLAGSEGPLFEVTNDPVEASKAYKNADYVIIAVSTEYDPATGFLKPIL